MTDADTILLRRTTSIQNMPSVSLDTVQVPRSIGSVELVREIGRGAMGVVWLGRDKMLNRDVAVKFLLEVIIAVDDPLYSRFLEGARAAAAVRHPGLTTIHQADLIEYIPYLVMEYVDGPTLAYVLHSHGAMSMSLAVTIMMRVCDAVAVLHDAGIVHRDIKPGNIMLNKAGEVFVTDFGISCGRVTNESALSRQSLAGTLPYMAPEMFDGTVSPRTDVYALGVTLFELLTCQLPYESSEKHSRIFHAPPLPHEPLDTRQVPQPLINLLDRALNSNPLFRIKTARQFGEALRHACKLSNINTAEAAELTTLILRPTASDTSTPDSSEQASPIPSSSYFDNLATLAKRHRQTTPAPVDPPRISVESTASPGTLVKDIHCVSCGYNLRGLPESGKCPECAFPTLVTVQARTYDLGDVDWIRRVMKGITQFHMASILLAAGLLCQIIGHSLLQDTNLFLTSGHIVFLYFFASVLSKSASSVSDIRERWFESPVDRKAAVRYRFLATVAAWGAFVFSFMSFFTGQSPEMDIPVMGTYLCTCVAAFVTVYYLRNMPGRIEPRYLIRNAIFILGVLMTTTFFGLATLSILAILGFLEIKFILIVNLTLFIVLGAFNIHFNTIRRSLRRIASGRFGQ